MFDGEPVMRRLGPRTTSSPARSGVHTLNCELEAAEGEAVGAGTCRGAKPLINGFIAASVSGVGLDVLPLPLEVDNIDEVVIKDGKVDCGVVDESIFVCWSNAMQYK